ncbi:unnamed protein product [Acanthoscelides obtectus]|uniref:Oxidoreductase-like domain-containing protein n=1 Tax=Acanthoscelides obtectus TaxID=200917 RepID=A0A9P0LHH4_ACAOB|nr:unnamed protein product [Acanthoscelides obtectus]CAK1634978.1 Oxidoreductase-like domain-containing protein 1 [Acanthoscelides obtectus]
MIMLRRVIHNGTIYQDILSKNHVLLVLDSKRRCSHEKDIIHTSVPTKNAPDDKVVSEGPPEEPTNCCMSGCPTCVWLDYAEKLVEYYKDGDEKALKEIDEKITDPSLKSYLFFELRMRLKKK